MLRCDKFWSGNVTGDRVGNFILELKNPHNQKLEGVLSFYDQENQLIKYFIWGEVQDLILKFACIKEEDYDINSRPLIRGEAFLNTNSSLNGKRHTNKKLKGCFVASRQDVETNNQVLNKPNKLTNSLQLKNLSLPERNKGAFLNTMDKELKKAKKMDTYNDPIRSTKFTIWDTDVS